MNVSKMLRAGLGPVLLGILAACASVTEEDRARVAQVGDAPAPVASAGDAQLSQVTTSEMSDPALPLANSGARARAILYRKWNGEGLAFMASGPKVEIDGRDVGRCLLGKGREIDLAAGEHVIRAPMSAKSERPFRIFPGQTIYVECRYTQGALVPNAEFLFKASRDQDPQ